MILIRFFHDISSIVTIEIQNKIVETRYNRVE